MSEAARKTSHRRRAAPAKFVTPDPDFVAPELEIESLDMEARGVGRTVNEDGEPGKVIFVEGALPGERVSYSSYRKKPSFEQAQVVKVLRESVIRAKPKCQFFGICGGCSMQHLDVLAQIAVKQRVLEDSLQHLSKLRAETMFRPIHGPSWGYRYRARLTVRHVEKKGGVLVGFHERKSSYVADMTSCEVLPPHVSAMLVPLRHLVAGLSIRDRMPQIELAVGSDVTALVLRILEPLTEADEALIRAFADEHDVQFWLQPKGPDTVYPFYPLDRELAYTLPEFDIRMPFKPTDFTQVNHQINRVLVSRALSLLAPESSDRVLDLFCGIGNFTLPLARVSREVVGIEGSEALTARALENAKANGVDAHTSFACRNLFEVTADDLRALGAFDKFLIDPPREGALAVSKALADIAQSGDGPLPERIVYVSCNPATLARDAGLLVHEAGYRMKGAGVVNMFPHTSHVESIALFERD
ncbi:MULTISPECIES: 23S rRNA (uracil(1939)-C(5))-methyltransferase RlmD [Caballeronia]|uniref:23S rRNA (uracil(1939)-C(5))-methyltransferase RlmD n=1 Tax=Caballeronia TaxID=1827195 RepID=UPI0002388186|nr:MULTISPECIES: 23S rRNA (uracil(1939)-C(5))-methyltransferase RlmD [unclassified Caballeronia]AET89389.1 RNA methyltransferase, TrmA family protein [Burkholderia sp. YI23]BAO86654.1 23S rRNA (uracil(1939)-C(5))-methyltransferase RlmD [Burkholderia sp. RPE67]BBP96549.1 23S rRNA (uracil(1939)-C(5))-methyltransferase RlmD [Burkholderia sp. SFA1]MCE4541560.1 23S rRNA (uracil(1939)-C(5))-methyltransferase RlmD [Caballeronia sp. PC1]MCE4569396.1 23S rRNA (uracil(1939)-C(5))-methyltransferase RlmD 